METYQMSDVIPPSLFTNFAPQAMHAAKKTPRFLAAPSYAELFGQFWEPETDLSLCGFYCIGSMDNIFIDGSSEVAADGARNSFERVGSAVDLTNSCDSVFTFDDHSQYGPEVMKSMRALKKPLPLCSA